MLKKDLGHQAEGKPREAGPLCCMSYCNLTNWEVSSTLFPLPFLPGGGEERQGPQGRGARAEAGGQALLRRRRRSPTGWCGATRPVEGEGGGEEGHARTVLGMGGLVVKVIFFWEGDKRVEKPPLFTALLCGFWSVFTDPRKSSLIWIPPKLIVCDS